MSWFDKVTWWLGKGPGHDEPKRVVAAKVPAPAKVDELVPDTKPCGWRRQPGYRSFMRRRVWVPRISGGVAYLASGRQYAVRKDGWRRLMPEGGVA